MALKSLQSILRRTLITPHRQYPLHSSKMAFPRELEIATLAVHRAAIATQRLFNRPNRDSDTASKADHSPVTIGDYAAQTLIIAALKHAFPNDDIVAEEEGAAVRADPGLRSAVWDLVRNARLEDKYDDMLGGPVRSEDDVPDILDQGNAAGGPTGRFWAIDPIDGTKGFLRGDQYAICVGLVVDGVVSVGVLGCPNLPIDDSAPMDIDAVNAMPASAKGVVFNAVSRGGAFSHPLGELDGPKTIIMVNQSPDVSRATMCESFEASHSSHDDHADIAARLGIVNKPVRMDSQAKYASLARGAGDILLRLPLPDRKTGKLYPQCIWDHAAGNIIVTEAGGIVSDPFGNPLDFGTGRAITPCRGIVAAAEPIHAAVIAAVQAVLEEKKEKKDKEEAAM